MRSEEGGVWREASRYASLLTPHAVAGGTFGDVARHGHGSAAHLAGQPIHFTGRKSARYLVDLDDQVHRPLPNPQFVMLPHPWRIMGQFPMNAEVAGTGRSRSGFASDPGGRSEAIGSAQC